MREEDHRVDGDDVRRIQRVVEELVEEGGHEERAAEVDAGGDGHLAQEVEPAREPAPCRRVLAAQLGRPVIESAGRGIAGADFCHSEAHQGHEDAHDRPADVHDDGAAGVHPIRVEGEAAGKDRNDGERDRKVGERRHPTPKLLRIAHAVEGFYVTVGRSVHASILRVAPETARFRPSPRGLRGS